MSDVMDRIRQAAAKAAAGPLAGDRERPHLERVAARSPFPPEAGQEDLVARFRAELEGLSARFHGPFEAEAAAAKVVEILLARGRGDAETRGRGEGHPAPSTQPSALSPQSSVLSPRPLRVLSWASAELPIPDLEARLRAAGIELVRGDVPNDETHGSVLEGLAGLEVGLSGAVAGLADTGSLVVASGPGRSRVASLLPPVHVALLPVSRLYPTMDGWLAAGGGDLARQTANLVVITGSSRTSDIELQLTLGMHGPKELHVLLC